MLTKSKYTRTKWMFPFLLLLLLMISCESRDVYVGTYKADVTVGTKQTEAFVELKPNGEGVWRVGGDEIAFSWYMKQGELRVNTKGGGVIVGNMGNNTIEMTLPGSQPMSFKKVP